MAEERAPGFTPEGYEFTPHENESLTRLTDSMRMVWLGMLAGGLGQMLYGIYVARWLSDHPMDAPPVWFTLVAISFFSGTILVVSSLILRRARDAFVQIVLTEGTDIDHLMEAISKLSNFFFTSLMLAWLLIFGLFLSLMHVRSQFL